MYTFKILYSYVDPSTKRTSYYVKYVSVAATATGTIGSSRLEAESRVRGIFARNFEGSMLLGVRFACYESHVIRDDSKVTQARALQYLADWNEAAALEAKADAEAAVHA